MFDNISHDGVENTVVDFNKVLDNIRQNVVSGNLGPVEPFQGVRGQIENLFGWGENVADKSLTQQDRVTIMEELTTFVANSPDINNSAEFLEWTNSCVAEIKQDEVNNFIQSRTTDSLDELKEVTELVMKIIDLTNEQENLLATSHASNRSVIQLNEKLVKHDYLTEIKNLKFDLYSILFEKSNSQ